MANTPRAIKHGTIGGYMAHQRRQETACGDCKLAWRSYYRNRNGTVPRVILNTEKAVATAKAKARKASRDAWNKRNPNRPRNKKVVGRPTTEETT